MPRDWNLRITATLTIAFPFLMLSVAAADIALSLIALLFLLHSYTAKDWKWWREGWVRILLLLWIYMIARSTYAQVPKDALERSLPFIRYLLFAAALAYWILQEEGIRRWFLHVLTAAVIFFALDAILQGIAGWDVLLHRLLHDPHGGHIRLSGPFTKPILGIMLAWLCFPAFVQLSRWEAEKEFYPGRRRYVAILIILLIMGAILFSGERMALLLTLFGWLAGSLLLPWRKHVLFAVLPALLLFGILAFFSPMMFERQVISTMRTLSHWKESPYGMLLKSDLALAQQHPIDGVGPNHFRIACPKLYPDNKEMADAMCNTHPHNIYLEWLIEEGVAGLALFCAFVLIVLGRCLKALKAGEENFMFVAFLTGFILRVLPFISATSFFSPWGAPPFWLVLGALLGYTAGKGKENAGAAVPVQNAEL